MGTMGSIEVERVSLGVPERLGQYGSALVALPDGQRVILTLPRGRAGFRLVTVDAVRGEVHAGETIRGELRDGLFEPGATGWLLTTHALCELSLTDGHPRLLRACRPRGLGKYQHRLLALGAHRLGVTGWGSRSVAVIDRATGTVVDRVRVTAPHLAAAMPNAVRLFAPHGGECVDLALPALAVAARRKMPTGTRPILHDGRLFLLEGVRCEVHDEVPIRRLWRVKPERLSVLDAESLLAVNTAVAPPEARDVLGLDASGRLVISTPRGIALASSDELHELERAELDELRLPLLAHAWMPKLGAVAALPYPPGPALSLDLIVFRIRGQAGSRQPARE
jgi:hypothetical protein